MNTHTSPSFKLSGTVLSVETAAPAAGLRVEAWDKSHRWLDVVDCTISDARGRFHLSLSEEYKKRLFPNGPAELYFKVFDGEYIVANTEATTMWSVEASDTEILLRTVRTADVSTRPSPFVVRGRVADAITGPLPERTVKAFDRNLSEVGWEDNLLGETTTNADGWYKIQYSFESTGLGNGKAKPDLLIKVFSPEGAGPPELLDQSGVLCHAETIAEVNVVINGTVYAGPSEIETLNARIFSAIGNDASHISLVNNDERLAYLACSTRVDATHLRLLRDATLLVAGTRIPVEVVYGLARMGIPTDFRPMLAHDATALRSLVERAIARNIIPATFSASLDDNMTLLSAQILAAVRASPDAPEAGALGGLLATSLSSNATQVSFLTSYLAFSGSLADFWAHLPTLPDFESPSTIADLQLTLHIGRLTHNNLPLMTRLRALRVLGTVTSLSDLTTYDTAAWLTLLSEAADPGSPDLPVPEHIPGATPTERASNYVAGMIAELGKLYPTAFLRQRMVLAPSIDMSLVRAIRTANPGLDPSRPLPAGASHAGIGSWEDARASWEALRREIRAYPEFAYSALLDSALAFTNPVREAVNTFLVAATDFDFARTHVDTYLAANPGALGSVPVENRPAAVAQIKATQRVFQVTSKAEHITTLLDAGLDSARRIARMAPALFAEQFGPAFGGTEEALAVVQSAKYKAAMMQSASTALRQASVDIMPWAIRGATAPPADVGTPDLAALFGPLELCDCEYCRSVYSAAAYFVDLLRFLDPDGWNVVNADSDPVKKPVDVLFDRRPDLQHIVLSCENTNTIIPYIDLVNEVLESYIQVRFVEHADPPFPLEARDTGTATAAELRAVPQYIIDGAYGELQNAVYPASLPFNRPLEVARVYLAHLGTSRYEVMKTFPSSSPPDDARLVAEELLLSHEEYQIIAGLPMSPARILREFYGYDAATITFIDTDTSLSVTESFQVNVARVPELLARTGVSYVTLIDLVKTWFVNREQSDPASCLTLASSTSDCDLEHTRLTHLDDGAIDRLHRFIRLWRRIGWSIADLDRALFALGAVDITEVVLRKLVQIKRLAGDLKRPVVQLLSLWSRLDTWNDDSLYLDRFQNRAVANMQDLGAFALVYPYSTGTPSRPDPNVKSSALLPEITGPSDVLRDHFPAVSAALGVTSLELDAVLESAGLSALSTLTVANLSALYRRVFLARALKIPVRDLVSLIGLLGDDTDPFQAQEPDGAVRFVESARRVLRSGFSVPALDYLYRDLSEPARSPAPTKDRVAAVLGELRAELKGVLDETAPVRATNEEALRAKLALVLDVGLLDDAIAVLDPASAFTHAERQSFAELHFLDFLKEPALSAMVLATDTAKLDAVGPPLAPEILAAQLRINIADVLSVLVPYLRDRLSRNVVVKGLANALDLSEALTRELLESLIDSRIHPDFKSMVDFLALVGPGLTGAYFGAPNLGGTSVERVDAQVSFTWNAESPPLVPAGVDGFSAGWTGRILSTGAGRYTFYVRSDGGVKLLIDGQLVIDQWSSPADAEPVEHATAVPIELAADTLYEITLEYTNQRDTGVLALAWSNASMPKEVVPVGQLYPDTAFASFVPMSETYRRLHKASLLIHGFKLTQREVHHISSHRGLFAQFDFNAFPPEPLSESVPPFQAWERLANLVALRDSLPAVEETLIDLFELSPALTDGGAMLAQVTGWDAATLGALLGSTGLNFVEADYHTEQRLIELQACVALSRRVGVSPERLFTWAAADPSPAQALDIVQTVKARYDGAAWLAVAEPLNDVLREQQRSALVAYLLPRMRAEQVRTDNDLFRYFLIDVDMTAVMATSRIKQAISSVQLFVQRCLLNLEPEVAPEHIDANQWKWRKNYRVWEANRKIFLYPENWIEPELRDDKSPFFRELETELLQNDLTDENAEPALLHYLEKVDDVALLEPCGMYWQEEFGDTPLDVLHVFARTLNEPRHYYYRRLTGKIEWSAWERVELDISAEQIIPVVHNRRLYLFWPVFSSVLEESQPAGAGAKARSHMDIKLVWSEYRSGRWTPKLTSSGKLTSPSYRPYDPSPPTISPAPEDHAFRTVLDQGTLFIKVRRRTREIEDEGTFIGSFWMDDCRGTVEASLTLGETVGRDLQEVIDFKYSHISAMSFEADKAFEPIVTPADDQVIEDVDQSSFVESGYRLVFENGSWPGLTEYPVLTGVPYPYRLLYPDQIENATLPSAFGVYFYPFFVQDRRRAYFALPVSDPGAITVDMNSDLTLADPHIFIDVGGHIHHETSSRPGSEVESLQNLYYDISSGQYFLQRLELSAFYHPFTCAFIRAMKRDGIEGVLTLENQQLSRDAAAPGPTLFESQYHPTDLVRLPYPTDDVSFDLKNAYSVYNWELFFHAPLLIATQLSSNQRYEDAQRWFHFIFDPTTTSKAPTPKRFWRVRPFHDNTEYARAQDLMALLSYKPDAQNADNQVLLDRKQRVVDQVKVWVKHPFEPHRIARLRLVAYQKSVVMKYIDNLLAWGDQLFSRDTIESINEATQLYVLASNILGTRPERVPSRGSTAVLTYDDMRGKLDDFSNVAVKLENLAFPFSVDASSGGESGIESILAAGDTLYFCTPNNDTLLGYWDTVADRLFKIRHGMNIEGVERQLALFEPPIDPAVLVRAAAAGVDLSSVLADLNAPLPYYRFPFMLQKALELCGELRSLGGALLAALEKKDGEALSALRSTHETSLLKAVRLVKQRQIDEAETTLAGLEKTRAVTEERYKFYAAIGFTTAQEIEHLERLGSAQSYQEGANGTELGAAALSAVPDFTVGGSGLASPVATATIGGIALIAALQSASKILSWKAGHESYRANIVSVKAGWNRRWDDWKLQERLAKKELAQIDTQIEAAKIRVEIAGKELVNSDLQIEQSTKVEDFLRDKYTSQELYTWMWTQVSALYFQTYKLTYDMAKRAERAYRFERGLSSSNYIQFGYWDSLKKGLLAGERLALDLKRLDGAYLEQNRREYEITSQISLALHDPASLIHLKEDGTCEIELPEELFDADYPGHYFRRIKSVSLTIPCVTGQYTNVNCTLTLLENRIRVESKPGGAYPEQDAGNDPRFLYSFAAIQSIATSHGQNDAGLFELNFRDERYLPFEGAGAVSRFRMDLPKDCNAIDFGTISDVVLKLSYTARAGGDLLRQAARASLDDLRTIVPDTDAGLAPPLQRMFSVRDEFATEWYHVLNPVPGDPLAIDLDLTADHFSYLFRGKNIEVAQVDLYLTASTAPTMTITPPGQSAIALEAALSTTEVQHQSKKLDDVVSATGTWTVTTSSALPADAIDMFIILTYTVKPPIDD